MRSPIVFGFLAVDLLGAGPSFGTAQNDHRPPWPSGEALTFSRFLSGLLLNRLDTRQHRVQRACHRMVHRLRLRAFDIVGFVAVSDEQAVQLVMTDPCQDGRIRNLVAVQVQNRQHGSVGDGIEEFVRMPRGRQRACLRLSIADDTGHNQTRIVEGGPIGMGQRVPQFSAFVDRARRLGCDVTRDSAGERKLSK